MRSPIYRVLNHCRYDIQTLIKRDSCFFFVELVNFRMG